MSEKTMSAKEHWMKLGIKKQLSMTPTEFAEAYHAHELAAIRKAVDGLVTDTMKKMQKAEKDSIESTVFAARALAFGDIQNILDAHKPKT